MNATSDERGVALVLGPDCPKIVIAPEPTRDDMIVIQQGSNRVWFPRDFMLALNLAGAISASTSRNRTSS